MSLELELAIRFLRRRRGRLLRGTALAALTGIALATAALVVTLALMNGYSGAIARALQRGNAHMVGFSPEPMSEEEAVAAAARLAVVEGVRRAGPVTYLTGLAADPREPANPFPVILKAVSAPPAYVGLEVWPEPQDGLPAAVVGARLAEQLALEPGGTLTVTLPPQGGSWSVPSLRLRVVGTFRLAFSEFDSRWVVIPLGQLREALPWVGIAGIELELEDPLLVERVGRSVQAAGAGLVFTDWRDMNRQLFAALRWQTLSLFVVLSLVVAVASFQISSALVVLAIDKRRTAGMLQALGATPRMIRGVLTRAGCLLGSCGVAAGIAIGWLASAIMTWTRAIRFPPGLARVYMVDHIPLQVALMDVLAVAAVGAVLVLAASWWPAWRYSRLDPVAALRAV